MPKNQTSIVPKASFQATTDKWYDYQIVVYPHHTDYAGVVWHGQYVRWLEEARIEYLNSIGVSFAQLVELGCDLPVIELSVRYHKALKLGNTALVRTRLSEIDGVKIHWDYRIELETDQQLCFSGKVTLVTVDRQRGKIMRQIPPNIKKIFLRLTGV